MKKYFNIWLKMSKNSFASAFHSKLSFSIFVFGKIFRFLFFVLFLFFLVQGIDNLAGYSVNETIFIFLTFNVIDVVGQFLFREVYRFKPLIISGDFDLVLIKPVNSLFRSLMGGADLMDLATLPLLFGALIFYATKLNPTPFNVLLYLLLLVNGLLITTAFHIAIIACYVRFFEIDYLTWLYRDMLNLGKLPVSIYKEPLRSTLVFLIPVATMVTMPATAMMGLVSPGGIILSLMIGVGTFVLATRFWNHALSFYTSASS